MLVDIEFNQPFNGIIFSKGYFARNECVYVKANPSKYSYEFTIAYSGCGTTAGGSAISASGTRRSDGFLRSSDDDLAATNATRSRRDVTNSSAVSGPLGRSLGGSWGGQGMGGAEPMGDPYAPAMQNQDFSGGGLGGGMGGMGGMGGDPYAGGQMGGPPGMGMMGGGQQYGPPQQGGYSAGVPSYGGNPQQGSNIGAPWNGNNGGQQGQAFVNNQNQGQGNFQQQQQQANVKVQSSSNSNFNSQSGGSSSFASSFPGGSKSNQAGQQQSNTQFAQSQSGQGDDIISTSSLAKTNQPFGEDQTGGSSRFFENIVIIQYDANIQEVWDVAKALRCEWHDNYHKTVSYKPFQVDSLEVVPATFAGDNVGVWMTVQQGGCPSHGGIN
jgi:hypothetical protein